MGPPLCRNQEKLSSLDRNLLHNSVILMSGLTDLLEIRVSQNLAKLGGEGRPIKCQGWKGERTGINWVAWEGEFQHWL